MGELSLKLEGFIFYNTSDNARIMINDPAKNLSLFNILDGLRLGLTQFSGPSRTALVYAEKPDDDIRVYDPQDLLQGHEPKLKEIYLDSDEWRANAPNTCDLALCGEICPEKNLDLSGLISFGGRTRSIFYQMWFTEQHPDMCSIGPTERWLEHAVSLLSLDFTFKDPIATETSSYALREYAIHAVRDHIRDELHLTFGLDTKVFVFPILDAILGISKTKEEGMWPYGKLVFISPEDLSEVHFLARFPRKERPGLRNFKHVRKLLSAVENSDRKLISFGNNIVGIAIGEMPKRRSSADFRGEYGIISFAGKPVCSFSDGNVYSSTRRANLVHLEEALLGSGLDVSLSHDLFKISADIVQEAYTQQHGCTLVIDFNDPLASISGQLLEQPLDLKQNHLLALAKSFSKVDGALHIGADLHLHGFACLLHGLAAPYEDRARGARFNSAIRFTAEQPNVIVVVVSSDRPVSVIQGGLELTAQCLWGSFSKLFKPPPTLREWADWG
jgi:Probable sensor domain DACND/Probable sensor domain DACNH/DisA bacterial checkpoint controller nucleotide-binding